MVSPSGGIVFLNTGGAAWWNKRGNHRTSALKMDIIKRVRESGSVGVRYRLIVRVQTTKLTL